MSTRIVLLVLALITALGGCASSAWREARDADTISAYHRFLREYPDTSFSEEARARLELARVRKNPSRESFEKFLEKFANAGLEAELRPHVEEVYFEYARALGTAEAYQEFLTEFPAGRFAARAEGNAAYLSERGYRGAVDALADFAERFPESDFAAEAGRSVAAVNQRKRSGFRRVGLVIEVAPSTPGGDRVARVFRDRAVAAYARAGLRVATLPDAAAAKGAGLDAVLRIEHTEKQQATQLKGGQVTEPSIVAMTTVTLQRTGDDAPIWSDAFEYRAPLSAQRNDVSILFGPGSQASYWAELDGQFFVPVARWSTQVTSREPQGFAKPAVAVEVVGNRAFVLFGDGDFQLFDLGDPARPVKLGEHRRKRDLASFEGVTARGARVAIYGADGVEVVRLDGGQTRREASFPRGNVGSVVGVEAVADGWIAATNRGLLKLGNESLAVQNLVPRPILGLARSGDRLVFTDGTSLFVATSDLLASGRVESELRLGRGFHPKRVRVFGQSAVVLGDRDAVWVDLRRPGRPRLLSRIGGNESGRVLDAAVLNQRLFLLGPRGLQVVDRSGERIVDSVDVAARERLDVSGRHLVMIGEKALQVVDGTAFVSPVPASPRR
ncbi:MAG: hypothetical protein AAF430_00035 [Myxococcota bacterium]